ncbi:pentatricopeptide repeat (PPR) superfamily protein [Tasmannia lanceolata]|uniref:pentatricopeptide repeat (PPR) superfamily protein n=1 Tax=Tasmannia lanceolata TaxID=3420 RepID=UPI0040644942
MNSNNIRKLVSDGLYREALTLYTQLHATYDFHPTSFTFPFLLKACGKLQDPPQSQKIHVHVLKTGFHTNIYTATALTNMYMKIHLPEDALKVFDRIPDRNLASLNSLISGFSQNGCFREALWAFKQVEMGGFQPNSVTLASVLPACESSKHGLQIHGFAVKLGHEMDIYVATAVLTMYSNCREVGSALGIFELIPEKNSVSYDAMISGFLKNGFPRMVLDLFQQMRESSFQRPSSVTLVSLLSACSKLETLHFGRQIHCFVLKQDMGSDVLIGTALVDMYSKCGSINWAYQVFMELGDKNVITWNSMISGMLSHGHCEIGVELFKQLKLDGFKPDMTTWNLMISGFSQQGNGIEAFRFFKEMLLAGIVKPSLKSITSLLPACSALSDLRHGKEIHGHIVRTVKDGDEFVSTALTDMYMKCGCSCWARRIFDQIAEKSDDPALWNVMISGYGMNGENELVLEIFSQMQEKGVQPSSATFISVLSACSHTGQVENGWDLFRIMTRDYAMNPTTEHFACMVDLLGRAGQLEEARDLIQEIPQPSASVFASLLGACRYHNNAELGEQMAKRLLESDPKNPTALVILSNIFAEQGKWIEVERVREMMNDRGLKKAPGCSWIGE